VTPDQLHILQHSLGLDQFGQGRMFRNHYVGDPEACRPLVTLGFMTEQRASELTGGDPWFRVTDSGKAAMLAESPKPPKLTRSQLRYRQFLDADSGMKFHEWLKATTGRKINDEDYDEWARKRDEEIQGGSPKVNEPVNSVSPDSKNSASEQN
jgi:hypothetical protein